MGVALMTGKLYASDGGPAIVTQALTNAVGLVGYARRDLR